MAFSGYGFIDRRGVGQLRGAGLCRGLARRDRGDDPRREEKTGED